MNKTTVIALVVALAIGAPAAAQPSIFIVRHAERADAGLPAASAMGADPDLSDAGHARADHLASLLQDAGITVVYVTQFKRTKQTAEPFARASGLEMTVVPQNEVQTLVDRLKTATGNVLVVGHSNTVPEILKALGVTTSVTLGDADYDNLFIVVTGDRPRLVRLHYR